jgi:thioredoxin 1
MRRLAVLSTAAIIILGQLLPAQEKKSTPTNTLPGVTFIELGSVKCIPCRMMQPVMKAIEEKYGDQVRVIFYDVWKEDQRKYADKYRIRLIPTQVFLDNDGKEIFRHEGFFSEKDIDAFLQTKGLRAKILEKE